MAQIKQAKHQDVPNRRKRHKNKKTRPPTSYTLTPGSLLQRANYSLLRLLSIVNAHSPKGITTTALLNEMGSKANSINAAIHRAERMKRI